METSIRKKAQLYGIVAVVLAIFLGIAVNAYPADVIPEKPILPPVALFTVSPASLCYITWTNRSGVINYNYPTLTFTSISYDLYGSVVDYAWDLDGAKYSGVQAVTQTYQNPGIYKATLTVTNDQGLNSTKSRFVTVVGVKTTLCVYPSEINNVDISQTFVVGISVLNVDDLGAWQAGLQVDPNILECVSFEKSGSSSDRQPLYNGSDVAYIINEGLFPGSPKETIWIEPKIDNAAGTIGPAGCCLGPGEDGVSGSGSLATITFRVKSLGSCTLEFIDVILLNAQGQEIPFNISYGSFESP
jgi:hypothetical protein